ncbi:MAG: tyrosine-protein phosphatase [Lachnospiraceae bacterium]|nr:tyrosine-protein phosphatase [Lachnospiraceae bacterium]
MKKLTGLAALVMCFCMLFSTAVYAEDGTISGTVIEVQKYGNLVMDFTPSDMLGAGFEVGDILTISVGENELEAPLCTSYSDVDTGSLVIRLTGEQVIVAINMGNFSTTYGVGDGETVTFTLKQAKGYLSEYTIRQLTRTNERADYSSDDVFANFRNVTTTGIADGVLFRSSSPVNNEIGRAAYADRLAEENGIETVVNLADSDASIESYRGAEDFDSPYYADLYDNGQVITLNMGVDLKSDDFRAKLAEGLEFMAENDAPYLIHCTEGKDRAGFVSAVIELAMGASLDEAVEDYMKTYENYYGVEKGSEKYEMIANSNIRASIATIICGLDKDADLSGIDLQEATALYLLGIGLSEDTLGTLYVKLSGAAAPGTALEDEEPAPVEPEPVILPKTGTLPVIAYIGMGLFLVAGGALVVFGARKNRNE